MSDNENNNNDLMPVGGSSPPTEEKPQTPHTDNDNDKDKSQSQETEGGEEPDVNNKEDENPNKENKNDLANKIGNSVGKVVEAVNAQNGVLIITADHGNCEQMIDYKTGEPHTAHTTNPVPLILVGMDNAKLKEGKLADLAPTMLDIMNLPKPEEMTGESIIVEK